ncbi:MAG: NAD(P)H-hydrate dehydratase [Candidatus Bipolaricaulota bacterium]
MRPVLWSQNVRSLDLKAKELGLSELLLMESAAHGAAAAVRTWAGSVAGERVVGLCGRGGNGGDALGMLRWLGLWGADPVAIVLGEPEGPAGEQGQAFAASFPDRTYTLETAESQDELELVAEVLAGADLVLDGLLGVGVQGPARGAVRAVIERLARCPVPIVAVDLPSGLETDTGALPGPVVSAALTLAMGALKPCHVLPPAAAACGEVQVVPVAYPPAAWDEVEPAARVLSEEFCAACLPPRPPHGHKGTFGRVLIVGGSVSMAGAAGLAASGALRAGAGLVHVLCPEPVYGVLEGAVPEALVHPGGAAPDGTFAPDAAQLALELVREADAVVVGPGIGRTPGASEVVRALATAGHPQVLMDADALYSLAHERKLLGPHEGHWLLTPHPGEFSRLAGVEVEQVVGEKLSSAGRAAQQWGATVVLKGAPTVVASSEGLLYLNLTGNTGLAHGGSGDVLAGVIGGLWAGGADPVEAACGGVYVHGKAAERLARVRSPRGVLPTDLLPAVPQAIARLERRYP